MAFNEDSRVKIPSILHLTRLGYTYLSLKTAQWDENTNIFKDIFYDSILRINPDFDESEIGRLYDDIALALENQDLGKAFYNMLCEKSGTKLIDFENFDNNSFHVVTELTYKNREESFRPDIILLINGIPLVFIEVKKPNNRDGILAERDRINKRFKNKKFRKFVNLTQMMIFSNNMEYDDEDIEPIQGAFYASPAYANPKFNYFREEETFDLDKLLLPEDDDLETTILKDNNLIVIKHNPEFQTNKNPNTPTNRLSTSLLSRKRLAFLLEYSIAYVKGFKGLQKHIMRYPQIFATKAIEKAIEEGIRKGIIWHTQGSGKTALAFYNVKYLTDYFQTRQIIPKFYFIVDRLDLLIQAKQEFSSRGLVVHTVNSRDEFVKDLKTTTAIHNLSGKPEITVVNIQKFKEDTDVVQQKDYSVNIQRIYFLDEVHRSYNPQGSFLANLSQSDKNAIKIGLTGTPLLSKDYKSRDLFGGYIHKYYYNASIADGYTLRLIREEIATEYRIKLKEVLNKIKVQRGNIQKKEVYARPEFAEPMLKYIIEDFEKFRMAESDSDVGAMVVCDSSDQAKVLFEIFEEQYAEKKVVGMAKSQLAAEPVVSYRQKQKNKQKVKTAALILHDIGTKDDRKELIDDYKDGKTDLLFVYNMLLTGFDAPRLKKLYLGRVIKRHNLLQALTRVNRTFKKFRYGYVVDFADIRKEFDATNKAYFDELQAEYGDEIEHYSNLFKSKEEIEEEILDLQEHIFHFDTQNLELFSQQVSQISDRGKMREIVKALDNAKSLYNLIRLFGHYELLEKLDFRKIPTLYRLANDHLQLLNKKELVENNPDNTNLLNIALEDVVFLFVKIGEEELVLADKLKDTLRQTREEFNNNFDPKDPEFISLKEELERLFKRKQLQEVTQEEMNRNIGALRQIQDKIRELNRKNNLLKAKYDNDKKYARIHKRLVERGNISKREILLFLALQGVKSEADIQIFLNHRLLNNEAYFETMMEQLVIKQFEEKTKIELDTNSSEFINRLVVKEYLDEFHGRTL